MPRRIQIFETKCVRRLLWIFYKEGKMYDFIYSSVAILVGLQETLHATIKLVKWHGSAFGHFTRCDTLPKVVLLWYREGEQYQGKLKKIMTNVKKGRGHPVSQFLNNSQYWPQW